MDDRTITVTPLTGSLGARIEGIDLGGPIGAGPLRELHTAILEHLVVCLPGQSIDDDAQVALARALGARIRIRWGRSSVTTPSSGASAPTTTSPAPTPTSTSSASTKKPGDQSWNGSPAPRTRW